MSNNHSEEEENPIQPPIDSESWCRWAGGMVVMWNAEIIPNCE